VFVFPSKTDTFGLVILEAMACGLPVAAYPVTGPLDIIENGSTGIVDEDLCKAAQQALSLNKADCIHYASLNSWTSCSRVFESMMFDNSPQTTGLTTAEPAR